MNRYYVAIIPSKFETPGVDCLSPLASVLSSTVQLFTGVCQQVKHVGATEKMTNGFIYTEIAKNIGNMNHVFLLSKLGYNLSIKGAVFITDDFGWITVKTKGKITDNDIAQIRDDIRSFKKFQFNELKLTTELMSAMTTSIKNTIEFAIKCGFDKVTFSFDKNTINARFKEGCQPEKVIATKLSSDLVFSNTEIARLEFNFTSPDSVFKTLNLIPGYDNVVVIEKESGTPILRNSIYFASNNHTLVFDKFGKIDTMVKGPDFKLRKHYIVFVPKKYSPGGSWVGGTIKTFTGISPQVKHVGIKPFALTGFSYAEILLPVSEKQIDDMVTRLLEHKGTASANYITEQDNVFSVRYANRTTDSQLAVILNEINPLGKYGFPKPSLFRNQKN